MAAMTNKIENFEKFNIPVCENRTLDSNGNNNDRNRTGNTINKVMNFNHIINFYKDINLFNRNKNGLAAPLLQNDDIPALSPTAVPLQRPFGINPGVGDFNNWRLLNTIQAPLDFYNSIPEVTQVIHDALPANFHINQAALPFAPIFAIPIPVLLPTGSNAIRAFRSTLGGIDSIVYVFNASIPIHRNYIMNFCRKRLDNGRLPLVGAQFQTTGNLRNGMIEHVSINIRTPVGVPPDPIIVFETPYYVYSPFENYPGNDGFTNFRQIINNKITSISHNDNIHITMHADISVPGPNPNFGQVHIQTTDPIDYVDILVQRQGGIDQDPQIVWAPPPPDTVNYPTTNMMLNGANVPRGEIHCIIGNRGKQTRNANQLSYMSWPMSIKFIQTLVKFLQNELNYIDEIMYTLKKNNHFDYDYPPANPLDNRISIRTIISTSIPQNIPWFYLCPAALNPRAPPPAGAPAAVAQTLPINPIRAADQPSNLSLQVIPILAVTIIDNELLIVQVPGYLNTFEQEELAKCIGTSNKISRNINITFLNDDNDIILARPAAAAPVAPNVYNDFFSDPPKFIILPGYLNNGTTIDLRLNNKIVAPQRGIPLGNINLKQRTINILTSSGFRNIDIYHIENNSIIFTSIVPPRRRNYFYRIENVNRNDPPHGANAAPLPHVLASAAVPPGGSSSLVSSGSPLASSASPSVPSASSSVSVAAPSPGGGSKSAKLNASASSSYVPSGVGARVSKSTSTPANSIGTLVDAAFAAHTAASNSESGGGKKGKKGKKEDNAEIDKQTAIDDLDDMKFIVVNPSSPFNGTFFTNYSSLTLEELKALKELKKDETIRIETLGHDLKCTKSITGGYTQKYLKYKAKYLALKKELENN